MARGAVHSGVVVHTVVRYGPAMDDVQDDAVDFGPDEPTPFDYEQESADALRDERTVVREPEPWSLGVTSIPPKLAAGLARCQAAAENVDFDGTNQHHRYKYATAAAVVAESRRAMAAGGLALLRVATWQEPGDERLGLPDGGSVPYARLWARYILTHESGEAITIESSIDIYPGRGRPTDKAQGAAISMLGKYVRAGLCGISWAPEPAEDVEQRDDEAQNREREEARVRQEQARARAREAKARAEAEARAKARAQVHPNPQYQHLLEGARDILRAAGKHTDPEKFWAMATGMDSMPKPGGIDVLRPHMLHAVVCAGAALSEYSPGADMPEDPSALTHSKFLEYCVERELEYAMDHGEPTPVGVAADEAVAKVEEKRAEQSAGDEHGKTNES